MMKMTEIKVAVLLVTLHLLLHSTHAQRCCTANQWEGEITGALGFEFQGTPGAALTDIKMHYDQQNSRFALEDEVEYEGVKVHYKLILNYAQGRSYIIRQNQGSPVCETGQLTGAMPRFCVPSDATELGQHFYGLNGEQLLAVDAWEEAIPDDTWYYTTTQKACMLVSITHLRRESNQMAYTASANLLNVRYGIQDSSVFTPPAICGSATGKQSMMHVARPEGLTRALNLLQHFMSGTK